MVLLKVHACILSTGIQTKFQSAQMLLGHISFEYCPTKDSSCIIAGGAHSIALEFAELYGSRDPSSGDSREKTILYINLLVAAGRLSDAVAVTRISKHTEDDVEMFNCFLDKCQQGVCVMYTIDMYLSIKNCLYNSSKISVYTIPYYRKVWWNVNCYKNFDKSGEES